MRLLSKCFLLGAALTLVHTAAFAAERVWIKKSPKQDEYLVIHNEEGGYAVDLFQKRPRKIQNRIWHKFFQNERSALKIVTDLKFGKEVKFDEMDQTQRSQPHVTEARESTIWDVQHAWDLEWERKYADWIEAEVGPNYFVQHQFATDCADVAFALRWIFARDHHLPAANRLSGTRDVFSQASMKEEWRHLPTHEIWSQDQRFLAALNFLLNSTYTHTLFRDSYPIAITPEYLRSGSYFLSLREGTGHTQIVSGVNRPFTSPVEILASNVPRMVRVLYSHPFFESQLPDESKSGMIRPLWAIVSGDQTYLESASNMPGMSMEQYQPSFLGDHQDFSIAVFNRLSPGFSFENILRQGLTAIEFMLNERKNIVQTGFEYCQSHDCEEGSVGYEDWSTPSRDQRLRDLIEWVSKSPLQYASQLTSLWNQALSQNIFELDGISYPLGKIIAVWESKLSSFDPRDSIAERWSLTPDAIVSRFQGTFQASLQARSQKISSQGDSCRTISNCNPSSSSYERWQTFSEDASLSEKSLRLYGLCNVLGVDQCGMIKEQLSTQFWNEKSLWEWAGKSILFNSDPRVALSQRWGELPMGYRSSHFLSSTKINIGPQGIGILRQNGQRPKLFKSPSSEPILLRGEIGEIHPLTSEIFTYETDETQLHLFIYDSRFNLLAQFEMDKSTASDPILLTWNPQHPLLMAQTQNLLTVFQKGQTPISLPLHPARSSFIDGVFFGMTESPNKVKIHDFTSGTLQTSDFNLKDSSGHDFAPFSLFLQQSTPGFYWLQSYTDQIEIDNFVLDKSLSESTAFGREEYYWADPKVKDRTLILKKTDESHFDVRYARIEENGRPHILQEVHSGSVGLDYQDGNFFLMGNPPNGVIPFEVLRDEVRRVARESDETFMREDGMSTCGSKVIFPLQNGKDRLRDLTQTNLRIVVDRINFPLKSKTSDPAFQCWQSLPHGESGMSYYDSFQEQALPIFTSALTQTPYPSGSFGNALDPSVVTVNLPYQSELTNKGAMLTFTLKTALPQLYSVYFSTWIVQEQSFLGKRTVRRASL